MKKPKKLSKRELNSKNHFRVTIFGSARTKSDDKNYYQVKMLAKKIGEHGFDLVTGGGEGIMGAATEGHALGDKGNHAEAIGLTIKLPWEVIPNKHLEIKKDFNKFSHRLDTFMKLSNVVVVMPGGVGTLLELSYTWQLIQVKHIKPIPIILVGRMWKKFFRWIKKYPLKDGWISPEDMTTVHVARNYKTAFKIILETYEDGKKKKR